MKALLLVFLMYFLKNTNALSLTMKIQKASKSNKSGLIPLYKPRTPNQKIYLDKITDDNSKVIIGLGPAGTGKTLFACLYAIQELEKGNIEKIV